MKVVDAKVMTGDDVDVIMSGDGVGAPELDDVATGNEYAEEVTGVVKIAGDGAGGEDAPNVVVLPEEVLAPSVIIRVVPHEVTICKSTGARST